MSVLALWRISSLPTAVDPVNDSLRMVGWVAKTSPTAGVLAMAVTTLTTPAGTPARWASSASARDVKGVSPGALHTTVHPAARAGPILRVIMAAGKFHGVIRPHTPTASFTVHTRLPATVAGMVSPYARGASSENHSRKLAAYVTSPRASASGLPFSHVINVAKSSLLATIRSYHLRSSLDLSRPVFLRNPSNAAAAAATATWVSVASNSGQVPMSSPVLGSVF